MKYEANEKKKRKATKNKLSIASNNKDILFPHISNRLLNKAVTPTATNIGHNILLGILLVISRPSLFRNFLSWVKLTLLFFRTTKGIPIIKEHTTITLIEGDNLAVSTATINPKGNAIPKTRFQKLSLFILASMKPILGVFGLSYIPPYSLGTGERALSLGSLVIPFSLKFLKSCIRFLVHCWFKLSNIIVPKFWLVCKGICTKILVLMLLILGFATNVAFGAEGKARLAQQLKEYITYVEKQNNIPSGLLLAIANVESGLKPFALNIEGRTVFAKSYPEAILLAKQAIGSGITNIDLGIMQVNYRWHNDRFKDIDEMLHPKSNIKYAGKLLSSLYKQHGCWHKAVRFYHSSTPEHHLKYSRKIVQRWLKYV